MKKFNKNQWLGIILLISVLIIYLPLPSFLSITKQLAPIAVLIIGIILLLK
ncbi:MAG: hypothetical protein QXX68_00985 [Candidatus Pacearchaeota archaeon]